MKSPRVPLDHLAVAAFAFDEDDRIVGWNSAAAALYGLAPVEAIGQSVLIFIPHEATDDFHFAVETVKRFGIWRGELRTLRTNHASCLVETAWSYTTDDLGNRAIVAVHWDVTERRQLQLADKRLAVLNATHSLATQIARLAGLPADLAELCRAFVDQPLAADRVMYSGCGQTIFLVAFEPLPFEWYRLLLECYHYRVLGATDRFQLHDRLQQNRDRIHLALVVGDAGTEAVAEIWKVRPLLPIVMIDPRAERVPPFPDHPVTVLRSPMTGRNLLHILALALVGEHGGELL